MHEHEAKQARLPRALKELIAPYENRERPYILFRKASRILDEHGLKKRRRGKISSSTYRTIKPINIGDSYRVVLKQDLIRKKNVPEQVINLTVFRTNISANKKDCLRVLSFVFLPEKIYSPDTDRAPALIPTLNFIRRSLSSRKN
jgi:hypothetical protein